ncbi:MAG: phage tail protein [Firmicutes bacterium]|nr:phage tail protein [Bacillota bacterium]
MPGERVDPYRNFHFRVEIDDIDQGGFSEVSGIDASIDVIEYRNGNEVTTPRKLPGLTKYGNITLKWGVVEATDLWEWILDCVNGEIERKNIAIVALDESGDDAARWEVKSAWPTKYTAPDFNGTGSEVAIETLEIVHESLERTA